MSIKRLLSPFYVEGGIVVWLCCPLLMMKTRKINIENQTKVGERNESI